MDMIDVGCAIIHRGGKLLIAQRYMEDSYGGYWEFPGGKREEGETIEACLVREAQEELEIRIQPEKAWGIKEHEVANRKIRLFFHFCRWTVGEPQAKECKDFRWVGKNDVKQFDFLPGDIEVLEDLVHRWDEYFKTF